MQPLWYLLTACLYLELALCILLCLPQAPVFLRRSLSGWRENVPFRNGIKVYALVVAIMFAGAFSEMISMRPLIIEDDHEEYHHYVANLLTCRINSFISGMAVFLLLVLDRLCFLTMSLFRLVTDKEVLQRQAKNVSSEYMKLVSKDDGQKKSKDEEELSSKLSDENKELKEKLQRALSEVQAIKKQAENQQETFTKLQEENRGLKNRLEDFNLVLGDAQKKSV